MRDPRELPAPSAMSGRSKTWTPRNQEAGPHETPKLLVPLCWTAGLQTVGNKCLLFKPPACGLLFSSPEWTEAKGAGEVERSVHPETLAEGPWPPIHPQRLRTLPCTAVPVAPPVLAERPTSGWAWRLTITTLHAAPSVGMTQAGKVETWTEKGLNKAKETKSREVWVPSPPHGGGLSAVAEPWPPGPRRGHLPHFLCLCLSARLSLPSFLPLLPADTRKC